jgi:hypothetical protein
MSATPAISAGLFPACPTRHPVAAGLFKVARLLTATAGALRAWAERLDAWLASRKQADVDSTTLEGMSERELRDIGIHPSHVGLQPDRWLRDWSV